MPLLIPQSGEVANLIDTADQQARSSTGNNADLFADQGGRCRRRRADLHMGEPHWRGHDDLHARRQEVNLPFIMLCHSQNH